MKPSIILSALMFIMHHQTLILIRWYSRMTLEKVPEDLAI